MASGRRESVGHASRHLEVIAAGAETRPVLASVGVWPFVELARRYDISLERVASHAQLDVAELRDPGARLSQVAANRIAELVFQRIGSHAAVEAAMSVEAGQFALFELLARTAPNVGAALADGSRFSPLLHSEVPLTHEVLPDGTHRVGLNPQVDYPIHHGFFEFAFGSWLVSLRREAAQPEIMPADVWFKHRAPTDRRVFDGLYGPGLRFSMPENRMSFAREVAAISLARKNSAVHAAAVRAAKDIVRRHDS